MTVLLVLLTETDRPKTLLKGPALSKQVSHNR